MVGKYSNEDEEITQEEIDAENEIIDNLFPDANFSICIHSSELEEVLTDEKNIVIQHSCNCYRCGDNNKTKYYFITGDNMTYKYIINELIKQGLKAKCDHQYLEKFYKLNNECNFLFDSFFGS